MRPSEVKAEGRRGKIVGKNFCCNFSHYMAVSIIFSQYRYRYSIPCSISRSRGWFKAAVVVVVVFFKLTDRASTIPSNTRTCLPIRYVVCWTEKYQRNIHQAPMRAKEKHKHTKNDKEKGTGITKFTGQKKIDEGHSIERVWHSASREPSGSTKYGKIVIYNCLI